MPAAGAADTVDLPLCVDMDGTLLRIDTLHEAAVDAVFTQLGTALRLPGWLAKGKARLKQELAKRWIFDAATLPYSQSLMAYLRAQQAAGRYMVLCTAAHRDIAERVAEHLGLFDEIIATQQTTNLRSAAKADVLCHRFGRGAFVYAGNDATDHAVWECAAAAVVVNASETVVRAARASDKGAIVLNDRTESIARATLRAMRPHQWVKNTLCLVPPIAACDFANLRAWAGALTVALAFCLIASGIYVLNDISDLTADRSHPRKSKRPFARGDLPVAYGLTLTLGLLLSGVATGWISGALPTLVAYISCSLAYTMWLKEKPLVDVFILAALYTLRLFGGGEASGHPVSLWLLGFSSFLFLSLALIKRVSELQRLTASGGQRRPKRRGYIVEDAGMLQMFGCSATFASAIVLSLYVQSDIASHVYRHPAMLWGAIPLLLFWQCRLWLSTTRGQMHDDPIIYASRDWVSWMVFACLISVAGAAWLPFRL
jgi:4-hydroxybenzoate polyprenyltransferase